MSDDTISRLAVLEHLKKRLIETAINNTGVTASCDSIFADIADNRISTWINEVPSAQPVEDIRAMCGECDAWNQYKNYPQPGWIPCTPETMPKNEEEVIVSILDDSGDNAFKYTASGWYAVAGDFWVVDNEMNRHVVAWMPLPKPYTGKDGDGNG